MRKTRRASTMKHRATGGKRKMMRTKKRSAKGTLLEVNSAGQVKQFEQLLKRKGALTIVFVYADWCPHCHDYKPVWKDITGSRGKNVNMVSLNEKVLSKTSIPSRTTIEGYPTVIAVSGTTGDTVNIPNYNEKTAMKTLAANGSAAMTATNNTNSKTVKNNVKPLNNASMDDMINDFINSTVEEPSAKVNIANRTATPYPMDIDIEETMESPIAMKNSSAAMKNSIGTKQNIVNLPKSDEDFVQSLGYNPEQFSVDQTRIEGQRGGRRNTLRRLRGGY
jgi:thiol-disulfide isomerase/thioredoxin